MVLLLKTLLFMHSPLPPPQTPLRCRRSLFGLGRVSPSICFCLFMSIHLPSPPSYGLLRDRHWCYDTCMDIYRHGRPHGSRSESFFSASRNSKSDVGFGLVMLSWSRSSLRVCTTKLIATSYHNVYPLDRASVFLCLYAFTSVVCL